MLRLPISGNFPHLLWRRKERGPPNRRLGSNPRGEEGQAIYDRIKSSESMYISLSYAIQASVVSNKKN